MEKHNITIQVTAKIPCKFCHKGYLIPRLKAKYIDEAAYNPKPEQFGHYEILYECSECGMTF
jgi:hypothetical protein